MIKLILGSAVLASIVWALKQPMRMPWMAYLVAQLASVPVLWLVSYAYGDASRAYAATYVATTGTIFLAVSWIVTDVLAGRAHRLEVLACAFVLSMIPAKLAFETLHRTLTPDQAAVLVEAALLLWAGIVVAAVSARLDWKGVPFTFGVFWILQGAFDVGWLMHFPGWQEASWIVGPSMGTVAFVLVGWQLRRKKLERQTWTTSRSRA